MSDGTINLPKRSVAPSSPTVGRYKIYVDDNDDEVKYIDESGTVKSFNGTDGVDGVDGTDGTDGDSAYEVAVTNGFIGTETEWLDSLEGAEGPQGPQGIPGPDDLVVIPLDGTAIYTHGPKAVYLVDLLTNNTQTINVPTTTTSQFEVYDSENRFNLARTTIVQILNADGVTIDHTVVLNKKNKSFKFFYNNTNGNWYWNQIGQGRVFEVS